MHIGFVCAPQAPKPKAKGKGKAKAKSIRAEASQMHQGTVQTAPPV